MLTDLGQLIHEGTKMKRALEMAKIAIPHRYKPISTRVKRAMADLVDKQEIGEYVQMKANYALKFKKTTDRKPLDATAIETLLAAIRDASSDITTAGLVLKCEVDGPPQWKGGSRHYMKGVQKTNAQMSQSGNT